MPTTYAHRLVLIVSAANRAAANAEFAAGLDPDLGGSQTFSVPLSPTGTRPATHYGASTRAQVTTRATMRGGFRTRFPVARVYDCTVLGWTDEEAWSRALEDAGLQRIGGVS